jgi:hypothetical protein
MICGRSSQHTQPRSTLLTPLQGLEVYPSGYPKYTDEKAFKNEHLLMYWPGAPFAPASPKKPGMEAPSNVTMALEHWD